MKVATIRIVTQLVAAAIVVQACSQPGDSGGAGPGASDGLAGETVDTASDSTPDEGVDVPPTDPLVDLDVDTIPDGVDNCVGLFNPDQADADGDGIGDVCDDADDDRDRDAIPNDADPFPDDAARPGTVLTNTVYAHTSSELYMFGVKGELQVELIGPFDFPAGTLDRRMTDIAVDRFGVMWGISFADVFVIEPNTAECWRIAELPQDFNGLTLVPREVLGTPHDALIGADLDGGWWRLELVTSGGMAEVQTTALGSFGSSWGSSGDAFSIAGVGTYATIDKGEFEDDRLAAVDPVSGRVTQVIATLDGYRTVFGLAGWAGRVYAFDEGGDVLVIDLATGGITARVATGKAWWGAGVRTVLDD